MLNNSGIFNYIDSKRSSSLFRSYGLEKFGLPSITVDEIKKFQQYETEIQNFQNEFLFHYERNNYVSAVINLEKLLMNVLCDHEFSMSCQNLFNDKIKNMPYISLDQSLGKSNDEYFCNFYAYTCGEVCKTDMSNSLDHVRWNEINSFLNNTYEYNIDLKKGRFNILTQFIFGKYLRKYFNKSFSKIHFNSTSTLLISKFYSLEDSGLKKNLPLIIMRPFDYNLYLRIFKDLTSLLQNIENLEPIDDYYADVHDPHKIITNYKVDPKNNIQNNIFLNPNLNKEEYLSIFFSDLQKNDPIKLNQYIAFLKFSNKVAYVHDYYINMDYYEMLDKERDKEMAEQMLKDRDKDKFDALTDGQYGDFDDWDNNLDGLYDGHMRG